MLPIAHLWKSIRNQAMEYSLLSVWGAAQLDGSESMQLTLPLPLPPPRSRSSSSFNRACSRSPSLVAALRGECSLPASPQTDLTLSALALAALHTTRTTTATWTGTGNTNSVEWNRRRIQRPAPPVAVSRNCDLFIRNA